MVDFELHEINPMAKTKANHRTAAERKNRGHCEGRAGFTYTIYHVFIIPSIRARG